MHIGDVCFALEALDLYDIVVLRYPAQRIDWFGALTFDSHATLYADSMVYWSTDLSELDLSSTPRRGDLVLRPATRDDLDSVLRIVNVVFESYQNHYSANPLMSGRSTTDGYVEWAAGLLNVQSTDLLLAQREIEGIVGFAAVGHFEAIGEIDAHSEVLLAGIAPDSRQLGLYSQLLASVERHSATLGSKQLVISTQVANNSAQRQWARAGWLPELAITTVHLVRRSLLPGLRSDHE